MRERRPVASQYDGTQASYLPAHWSQTASTTHFHVQTSFLLFFDLLELHDRAGLGTGRAPVVLAMLMAFAVGRAGLAEMLAASGIADGLVVSHWQSHLSASIVLVSETQRQIFFVGEQH